MDWWTTFIEGLKEFFSQPVPVIGCTIGGLCFAVLTILSKTSYGKKSIKKLFSIYKEGRNEINKFCNEYQEFKSEKENQVAIIKTEYDNKLAIATEQYNEIKSVLLEIAKVEPNKKVKEIIERFKVNANTEIKGISEVVDNEVAKAKETYKSIFEKELAEIKEQYQKNIDSLNSELQAIKNAFEVNTAELKENAPESIKIALVGNVEGGE